MQLIDTHCHLDLNAFDNDRETVIKESIEAGINHFIVPGLYPEQWKTSSSLFNHKDSISLAAGIHPCFIDRLDKTRPLHELKSALKEHLQSQACIAIGECGLDSHASMVIEEQKPVFTMQVELASELSLPLIIHHRKTHNDIIEILKKAKLPAGGVIHAFSGSYDIAKTYWDMGFYLGIGGIITYERANKTRQAINKMPIKAWLLETDSPDMPINGKQGKRNTPIHLNDVLLSLSQLTGQDPLSLAEQTTMNAKKLFGI